MMNDDDQTSELADRLCREAMNERPPFSPELHRRMMNRVRAERVGFNPLRISFPRWKIAASVAFAACTLAAVWMVRFQRTPMPNPPVQIAIETSQPPDSTAAATSPGFDFDGMLSAELWPPRITVGVPSLAAASPDEESPPPAESIALPGSPHWLFAALQTPTTGATTDLTDIVPPALRPLVGLPPAAQ